MPQAHITLRKKESAGGSRPPKTPSRHVEGRNYHQNSVATSQHEIETKTANSVVSRKTTQGRF